MSQARSAGAFDDSLGYVLKQAATALHVAMERALRPLGLTLPQYSCLEHLERMPGQSNADLARAVFVSPQSMNEVLRGLQQRGLAERPASVPSGRARPASITPAGSALLKDARIALDPVDQRLHSPFDSAARERILRDLHAVIAVLDPAAG